jgi:hypothetical protein
MSARPAAQPPVAANLKYEAKMTAARRPLPTMYLDEHINSKLLWVFRQQKFRAVLISRTAKYSGRDEKDYIGRIKSEGAVFCTMDIEFVEYVVQNRIKHAGIVLLPSNWDIDTLTFASAGTAGAIRGMIENKGRSFINNKVFYIADDGYHIIENSKDRLDYSLARMILDIEEQEKRNPSIRIRDRGK